MKDRLTHLWSDLTAKTSRTFEVAGAVASTIWTVVWFTVYSFLLCLLSGGILFLVAVIVVAFLAWLFGADSPRDAALTTGAIAAALWTIGEFTWRIVRFFSAFAELVQKRRVEEILNQDD